MSVKIIRDRRKTTFCWLKPSSEKRNPKNKISRPQNPTPKRLLVESNKAMFLARYCFYYTLNDLPDTRFLFYKQHFHKQR